MEHHITLPMTPQDAKKMQSGDTVYLTGTLYTARDAAHKRMIQLLEQGKELPFPMQDATIYYVGPTPAPPGHVIGSAGPTTSYRMDAYAPALLDLGLRAMIGKGRRSPEVIEAMVRNNAVYLAATGGAGALLATCITQSELVAFPELGAEAIRRLEVKNFPTVVVIDTSGNNLYTSGPEAYTASR